MRKLFGDDEETGKPFKVVARNKTRGGRRNKNKSRAKNKN